MPRSISITKTGGSTIVKQWNKADLSDTITKVYNMPVNYTRERNVIIIDASGDHNRLVMSHGEITSPVSADLDALVVVLATGNYFK
jgi:hypothetical protein